MSRKIGNRRYKRSDVPKEVDVVIIGSGQGGLSCGAVLSQHFGETVVVCEQHEVVGGGAHTYAVEGKTKWKFDAGLHITIPPHEKALQVACGSVVPPVKFARLGDHRGASDYIKIADEEALPVVPGPSGFSLFEFLFGAPKLNVELALAKRFPNQAKALRRYFRIADAVRCVRAWCSSAKRENISFLVHLYYSLPREYSIFNTQTPTLENLNHISLKYNDIVECYEN